jgi:hypothetical protein
MLEQRTVVAILTKDFRGLPEETEVNHENL